MFEAILTYIGAGLGGVFGLFTNVFNDGIGLFWDDTLSQLTQLGELLVLSAIVGLAMFGMRFIRGMIPFVK
jgi:hypothetical protein